MSNSGSPGVNKSGQRHTYSKMGSTKEMIGSLDYQDGGRDSMSPKAYVSGQSFQGTFTIDSRDD